ncbi:alpha/beta fold hydrolase [Nonomuraea sp. NEAU-A123]|uniref:alpha/beta fold hydrolase n=1 Tax=Nonomuraea sp. NEAU-A123 TaxID=2839649 RepID=UPI001BE46065|nr:alpha/beta fold hydrolase [Nonomuraea sp. NEAU-A123]MBT2231147.1 alpha/beta hydrolase [Nonomuraea sp. NEAU-A123]
MRRRTNLLATAFLALAALLPVPAAGAATEPEAGTTTATRQSSITWAPCEEEPSAECGKLTVPIDWSKPNGETIDLAIARRKATDPTARVGSLVINPGGPGGSGVEAVYGAPGSYTEELQKRFDIVGFDPRGVGRSHPVICSASVYNQMPHTVMSSQADYNAWDAFTKKLHQDCRARTGPLYDHVDSRNVARDMDALRSALGEEKLTYYGISYGTLMGQMYAEMFPNRIRALALDSNMDHSLGVAGFLSTEAIAIEDSFDEFVGWCEADTSCVLHGRDVRQMWRDLRAKARRGELRYPTAPDRPMTELQVIYNAALGTEGPDWRLLSEVINWLSGGPEPSWVPPLEGRGPVEGDTAQLPTRILCQDYNLRVRNYAEYAFYMGVSKRLAPDVGYHPYPIDDMPICLNSTTTNPPHQLKYTGDTPILLGNSLHDPATPYMWSANAARQLGPKAVLLTYEGWGHRIYGKDKCQTDIIDQYLIALTVPPPGTRCAVGTPEESMLKQQQQKTWPTDKQHWAAMAGR